MFIINLKAKCHHLLHLCCRKKCMLKLRYEKLTRRISVCDLEYPGTSSNHWPQISWRWPTCLQNSLWNSPFHFSCQKYLLVHFVSFHLHGIFTRHDFQRTRLIRILLGQSQVNGVLIPQCHQRDVLLIPVCSLGCPLGIPTPKGPDCYVKLARN